MDKRLQWKALGIVLLVIASVYTIWPVFNIADSAITIGAVLLAWNIIKNQKQIPNI